MRAWIVFGVSLLACSQWAEVAAQGTGRSLDIQPGARESALGAAGVALVGEPSSALWWNPAALAMAEWHSVQYTHSRPLRGLADDVVYNQFAVAAQARGRFGYGASGTFLSYGTSTFADPSGNPISFQSSEWSWAAAVGYRILPELAAGLTMKYVRIKLAPASMSGEAGTVGFDFGGLYRKKLAPVTFGAGVNVQNIGPPAKFPAEDEPSPLSRNLKLGAAATAAMPLGSAEAGVAVAVDYNQSLVTSEFRTWHYGGEVFGRYGKWVSAALRGGYYDDALGNIQDATYGAGIRFAGATVDFSSMPTPPLLGLERVEKWTIGFNTDMVLPALEP